jgi:hypothetical protein
MAFDISKVPPEDSRGFYYWRTNANPADIASYYKTKENLEAVEEEEVVSLKSGFDTAEDPFVVEQPLQQTSTPEPNYDFSNVPEAGTIGHSYWRNNVSEEMKAAYDAQVAEEEATFSFEKLLAKGSDVFSTASAEKIKTTYDVLTPEQKKILETYDWDKTLASNLNLSGRNFNMVYLKDPQNAALYAHVNNVMQNKVDHSKEVGGIPDALLRDNKSMAYKNEGPDYLSPEHPTRLAYEAEANEVVAGLASQNIPMSMTGEDGTEYYLNTGTAAHLHPDVFKPDRDFEEGTWVEAGPVGSYGLVWIPNTRGSIVQRFINSPVAAVAAQFIPNGQVALTLAKAADGQTLHGADYLTLTSAGLDAAGITKPPSGLPVDGVGPVDTVGVGLGGLSYADTQALLAAAATGDPVNAAVGLLGTAAVNKAFENVDGGDRIAGVFQADDAQEALTTVVTEVAQGSDLDDAMLTGLATYVREGGGLGDGLDVDLGIIEDVVKALVKPVQAVASAVGAVIEDVAQVAGDVIEDVAQPVGKVIEDVAQVTGDVVEDVGQVAGDVVEDVGQVVGDVGSIVDDEIIQPYVRPALQEFDDVVLQPTGDAIEDVGQVIGDVGSAIDDAVLQPAGDVIEDVAQVTGDVVEDVGQVTGDVAEDVGQAVGDVAEDLAQAIAELVPDIELPDISTPDIDLPDVNLPDIDWKDLFKMFAGGMLSGAATQVVPSPTRTTDDLFGFETEVGLGDIELAQLQRRYLG